MKIAVMGAGAVGCFFGALLAKAGHEVMLIGRPAHVEAIRAGGLLLEWTGRSERVVLGASTDPAELTGAELVLVCVKSGATEEAGARMAPYLAPEAMIVSLQNGVGNAQRLTRMLERPVFPAAVYVAVDMAGAGHVRHHGRGELVIGSAPRVEELAMLLGEAGIPTTVSDEVEVALWSKLVLNCAYNALSAIARQPYGQLLEAEGVPALIRSVLRECMAVAAANGVYLPEELADEILALGRTMPGQFSSTAQDLIRGRATEIDYLNGYIVQAGAEHGIAAPVNQALTTIVKLLERGA
ncbi:ketopantoate reductase family protein [Acidocella sp.]|uniref:ketopantoate reductase family protein n=1 Tax=Acidocella sp. TaxID=50710 RepID=UPI003D0771E3